MLPSERTDSLNFSRGWLTSRIQNIVLVLKSGLHRIANQVQKAYYFQHSALSLNAGYF